MTSWKCPNCDFLMTEIEYMNIEHDVGCAKCYTSLWKFNKIKGLKEIKELTMKVLITNGPARSGKGTVTKYLKELFSLDIVSYSSIDYVKKVAEEKFGWDKEKDIAGRNLLAGIKQLMINYNDLPTKRVILEFE